jgi:hypothetical protein
MVVQATGLEPDASAVRAMVGSFKAVKEFARFDVDPGPGPGLDTPDLPDGADDPGERSAGAGIKLGYTINLNLPATTDIAVFNAIFKSLREHLVR